MRGLVEISEGGRIRIYFEFSIYPKKSPVFYNGSDDLFLESPLTAIVKFQHFISGLSYRFSQ